MANQVKISGGFSMCGGYDKEDMGFLPTDFDKITTATSGTEYYSVHFSNSSWSSNNNSQVVTVKCHYNWSVTFDEYANMTLKVHGYVDSVVGSRGGTGNPGPVNMFLRIGMGRNNIKLSTNYNSGTYGNIYGAADLGEITRVIKSGSGTSITTLYVKSGYAGHENDDCNNSVYVDEMSGGLVFNNPNAIIYVPPVITPKCETTTSGGKISATFDYKNGDAQKYSYCVATDNTFKNCVKSGSGTGTTASVALSGLAWNTKYYVRWTADNGKKTSTADCSFVTLTPNTITSAVATGSTTADVRLTVQYGNKAYAPSTQLQYKKCSESTWHNAGTTNTTTTTTMKLTGLTADTCYQVRAITTTTAGVYTGNTVQFQTLKECIHGSITSVDLVADEETYMVTATVCVDWEAFAVPSTVKVQYRMVDGYDPSWIDSNVVTINGPLAGGSVKGNNCFTIPDLFPNLAEYEVRFVGTSQLSANNTCETDGAPQNFITPMLPEPDPVQVCATMTYLADLVCQAVKKLYDGNKTIFANPTSAELCDPYGQNPTLLSITSRILRFSQAMNCLLCNMNDIGLKAGTDKQYYVGELGWVDILEEVLADTDDESWRLVTSGVVKAYIDTKLHEVWHYHMAVDYLVATSAQMNSLPASATSCIVGNDNKVYIKKNGAWVLAPSEQQPDNFAVYHINNAYNSAIGNVKAESAWYYFEGTWNNLDADSADLAAMLEKLSDDQDRVVMNEANATRLHIDTVDKDAWNCSNYPSGERWVSFITESMTQPAPVYHTVTFTVTPDEDDWMPTRQSQKVIDGGLIQVPTPLEGDCDFIQWEDANNPGVAFNFNTVVKKDYNLVAQLDCGDYITTESSVIITAENGDKFVK